MELAVTLVVAVLVLLVVLAAIVFYRDARKALNERMTIKLFTSSTSPTRPMESMQTPQQHHHQQQQQPQQLPMRPPMPSIPFPPHLQMTPQQMQQMTPQQIQHTQQLQQLWQMQQQVQQMQMRMHGQQQQQQPQQSMNPYFQKDPMAMMPANPDQMMPMQLQSHRPGLFVDSAALTSSGIFSSFRSVQDPAKLFPELTDHRLDENDVTMTRKISTGSFGVVWLGHYYGKPVAVKKMINGEEEAQLFAKEILIMARMNHPKIVKFLGCIWTEPSDLGAVTEYMTGGDLSTVLEDERIDLSWPKEKISIAIDIAEALQYMHSLSPKLIHRDLKSRNVLLNSRLVAKLSDFGLSRNRTFEESLTAGVGTLQWTAPEVMLGENYSEQADIYSLGVVLAELDTRQVPFAESSSGKSSSGGGRGGFDMNVLIKVAKGELRPSFAKDVPSCIDQIAHACLQFDPELRPTASQVLVLLKEAKVELMQVTL